VRDLFLLDTNHVSDFITGRSAVLEKKIARELDGGNQIAISTLTHAEVLFGFAQNPAVIHARIAYDKFLHETKIVPWTVEASVSYAQLRLNLKLRGLVIDTIDLLIASQAHALGAMLITRDKAFRHIAEQIEIVNWATDLM
jgi:tRNA(fMet)-specific endonuclease VapC